VKLDGLKQCIPKNNLLYQVKLYKDMNDIYNNMDNIEFEILKLCKKNKLNDDDINFLNYVFSNDIIDVNYEESEFFNLASYYKNNDMLNVLNANYFKHRELQKNDIKLILSK
jgi:hypothetical protein